MLTGTRQCATIIIVIEAEGAAFSPDDFESCGYLLSVYGGGFVSPPFFVGEFADTAVEISIRRCI